MSLYILEIKLAYLITNITTYLYSTYRMSLGYRSKGICT